MIYLFASILLALSVSFLCSLLESSVLSLRPSDIAKLRARDESIGDLWHQMGRDIGRPIAAILILNTVANTIGATIAGAEFARLFGKNWLWLFSVVFAFVIIQWGEILPKTIGVRYRAVVATHIGRPLRAAVGFLRPAMWLTRLLNRPFEPKNAVERGGTVEEIRALASYASFAQVIDRRQENIITKSVQLHEMTVAKIMVPRTRVVALREDAPLSELLELVHRHGFSRIPVFRDRIDEIVGVVLAKDLLIALHGGRVRADEFDRRQVRELMTEPTFVPVAASVAAVMARANESNAHMVIVVDEHGGFAGVVTLEDALEEMFGEIVDEHDRAEVAPITKVSRGRWIASGHCSIEDLSRQLAHDFRSKRGRYRTLSGLLMLLAGKVPAVGDVVASSGYRFRVIDATPTFPRKIEITRS